MFMKGIFLLFISLALGYILCILAHRQKGVLKTLGYTLGISIMALSFLYGIFADEANWCQMIKGGKPQQHYVLRPYHHRVRHK